MTTKITKQPQNETENQEKVLVFYDINAATATETATARYAYQLNETVMAACKSLGFAPTDTEQMLAFAKNPANLRQAFINLKVEEAKAQMATTNGGSLPDFILTMLTRQAEQDADAAINQVGMTWPTAIPILYKRFLFLDNFKAGEEPHAEVASAEIEEHFKRYLMPQETEIWHRLQELAAELNDLFKGRITDPLNRCFYTIPGDKTNHIYPSKTTPFADLLPSQQTASDQPKPGVSSTPTTARTINTTTTTKN